MIRQQLVQPSPLDDDDACLDALELVQVAVVKSGWDSDGFSMGIEEPGAETSGSRALAI